jgi:hypothetical protein
MPYSTRFETLASKLNIRFDAIKMLPVARSASDFSSGQFPPATLIFRLYEFLKNSREPEDLSSSLIIG